MDLKFDISRFVLNSSHHRTVHGIMFNADTFRVIEAPKALSREKACVSSSFKKDCPQIFTRADRLWKSHNVRACGHPWEVYLGSSPWEVYLGSSPWKVYLGSSQKNLFRIYPCAAEIIIFWRSSAMSNGGTIDHQATQTLNWCFQRSFPDKIFPRKSLSLTT